MVDDNVAVPITATSPARRPRPRVVVREMIAFQEPQKGPQATTVTFVRHLESDEQPFRREMKSVGTEWVPLQTGWLQRASLLLLSVEKGSPTVELGLLVADVEPPGGSRTAWSPPRRAEPLIVRFAAIPGGESSRFTPADLQALRIRCLLGGAKCVLLLYPE